MAETVTDIETLAYERANAITTAYVDGGLITREADRVRTQVEEDIHELLLTTPDPTELEFYIPISKLKLGALSLEQLVALDNKRSDASSSNKWWNSATGTFVFPDLWEQYQQDEIMPGSASPSLVRAMLRDGVTLDHDSISEPRRNGLAIDHLDPSAFIALSLIRRFDRQPPLDGFTHFPQLAEKPVDVAQKVAGGKFENHPVAHRPYAAALTRGVVLGKTPITKAPGNDVRVRYTVAVPTTTESS